MDGELYALAERVGAAGALLLLLALVAQYRGYWFSAATVTQLTARLTEKDAELERMRAELAAERERHGGELDIWEQRTFSALGVADRLSRLSEDQLLRTQGVRRPTATSATRRTDG